MDNHRPIASLSPRLLARKGGAKPAMRPHQAVASVSAEDHASIDEDLGWNDLGDDHEAQVVPISRGVQSSANTSEVRRQQKRLNGAFAANRKSAAVQGRKAAFTLRLDEDRHLKLRLASAAGGRSAQTLLTEALDRLFDDLPEVAELAGALRTTRKS